MWTTRDGSWNHVGTIESPAVEPVRWGRGILLIGDGVWSFDGSSIETLTADVDLSEHHVSAGSWGMVAAPLFPGRPLLFSPDGREWVELDSGNFGDQDEPSLQVVGLGDGFVVLVEQSGWGDDSPRPLWIGRP